MRTSAESRRGAATAGTGIVSVPERADTGTEADAGDRAAPHCEQKFWPGAVGCPQSGHDVDSADPHSMQYLAPD